MTPLVGWGGPREGMRFSQSKMLIYLFHMLKLIRCLAGAREIVVMKTKQMSSKLSWIPRFQFQNGPSTSKSIPKERYHLERLRDL